MRRSAIVGFALVALMAASVSVAVAQYEDHPNVGTWLTWQPEDPSVAASIATVTASGTVRDWTIQETGVGSWEPTGDRTFVLYPFPDEEGGFFGYTTARIIGEISEDGQTALGTFILELPDDPSGAFPPPGEWGPSPFMSTRVNPEPPGETVGPWPLVPPPVEE